MRTGSRLIAGIALACAAWPQSLDYSPASPTDEQINQYLTRKESPMSGIGASLVALGREYEVDPRLVVAISGAETTFGKHVCAENNAWNWFHHRTCPQSPFAGYQEGAERVTKFLRLSYLNQGYDSIELIQHKYCASGCANWTPLVTNFYAEMPANAVAPPQPVKSEPAKTESEAPPPKADANTTPPKPASDVDEIEATLRKRVFGAPMYVVVLVGVLAVGAWAVRGLPK